jgi:hypothetical protein
VPGPNACYCRMCIMARWRSANRHRRNAGLPPLPRPNVPRVKGKVAKGAGCPCKVCVANRLWANRKMPELDQELDRRALERWPAEWGKRA